MPYTLISMGHVVDHPGMVLDLSEMITGIDLLEKYTVVGSFSVADLTEMERVYFPLRRNKCR